MELINKLETTIAGWVKNVPHLPPAGQKWLGQNVWWIALIGAILSGIALLFSIGGLFTLIALLSSPVNYYYVSGAAVSGVGILSAVVSVAFLALQGLLLALAVKPLKDKQRKGWKILFLGWLLSIASIVIGAVLSFSPFGFITNILFGAIGVAISGYFLFEIHGQFVAHRVAREAKVVSKKA